MAAAWEECQEAVFHVEDYQVAWELEVMIYVLRLVEQVAIVTVLFRRPINPLLRALILELLVVITLQLRALWAN